MAKVKAESLKELRRRRSAKWRAFEADVLPLPVAEMDFPIAKPIQDELIDMIRRSDLGYGGFIPELPRAFANYAKTHWNWDIDTEQFRLATDVGVAGVEVLRLVTQPGDKVVINSPVYLNFFTWISEVKCEAVDVPLISAGSEWALDATALEAAFADGAKAYILCHPHNPVGHVYSRTELERIAELAEKYDVLVISDEIHAPLTFKEANFIPYLAVNDVARKHGVCITSASKSWNLAGLKCAQIVSQDPDVNELLSQLPVSTSWRASILGGWASVVAYNDGQAWLDSVMKNLDANRHYLERLVKKYLPKAKYSIPRSTYLAWIDLRAYELEKPADILHEKARIALSHGEDFGTPGIGHVRLNFATSKANLKAAIKRIAEVLED